MITNVVNFKLNGNFEIKKTNGNKKILVSSKVIIRRLQFKFPDVCSMSNIYTDHDRVVNPLRS